MQILMNFMQNNIKKATSWLLMSSLFYAVGACDGFLLLHQFV